MNKIERHDTCPECGADIAHRHGKYGCFVGCSNFPECHWTCSEEDWDECGGDPEEYKRMMYFREIEPSYGEIVNGG